MVTLILELKHLKNNVDYQCIPITLFVIAQNQFEKDKRTKINELSFNKIKQWTDWGDKRLKNMHKALSGKDKKIFYESFHGNFNIEEFHTELNHNIRKFNLRLEHKFGFTSKDIENKLQEGKYPMIMLNPQYINEAKQNIPKPKNVRGNPKDMHHFICIHGIDNEKNCWVYDCDLPHNNNEVLSNQNIKCKVHFDVLKKHSQDINNSLYWFDLIDTSEKTSLLGY